MALQNINRKVQDLAYRWRVAPVTLWLLLINVGVYLLATLARLFTVPGTLGGGSLLHPWLALPSYLPTLMHKPWTLLTYMFYHEDLLHILFNMLWFWVFAKLFLENMRSKQLVIVYLLGGLAGGLLYVLAYNIFPLFRPVLPVATALGASASIMAVTLTAALISPHREVYLYGLIRIRIITLVLIVVGLDLLGMVGHNAGGHIAHLGGAALGTLYVYYLRGRLRIPSMRGGFHSSSYTYRSAPRVRRATGNRGSSFWKRDFSASRSKRTKKRGSTASSPYHEEHDKHTSPPPDTHVDEARLDAILTKLRQGGYSALTTEEKEILFHSTK